MFRHIALACALAGVVSAAPAAQEKKEPAGSLTDVTGTWVMEMQGHQMALELEQKDTKVEGVLNAMGRRILLIGDYSERKLTLKGERPEDGFTHGENPDAGPIVATMLDNGTLEGELSTNKGRMKWTGERFKPPQRGGPQPDEHVMARTSGFGSASLGAVLPCRAPRGD